MVKPFLTLVAIALVAAASAAPFEQFLFNSHSTNNCATAAKEFQSIDLDSVSIDTFLSTRSGENVLVGGFRGDNNFDPVAFCVVTHAVSGCDEVPPASSGSCIQKGVDYRIRVEGEGMNGYITRAGDYFIATPEFNDALPFNIDGDGQYLIEIRLGVIGPPVAWTVRGPGEPVFLEMYYPGEDNQKFRVYVQNPDVIQYGKLSHDNQCVPEVSVKEYRPFLLKSSNLNTLVSKPVNNDLIVGGPKSADKNYKQLELCVVSSDYGCSTGIKSNCIYQDIPYRIRVNSPVEGYLRITGQNTVEIVHSFAEASRLNLYKEAGWGLRIAHLKDDGSRIVFSATKEGYPIVLEEAVTNAARQWFTLIKAN
ncbi:hypothetical protein BG004_003524 [Podila humilis]|nr:hypothetical protein BG004_003524 [Podila humilis]